MFVMIYSGWWKSTRTVCKCQWESSDHLQDQYAIRTPRTQRMSSSRAGADKSQYFRKVKMYAGEEEWKLESRVCRNRLKLSKTVTRPTRFIIRLLSGRFEGLWDSSNLEGRKAGGTSGRRKYFDRQCVTCRGRERRLYMKEREIKTLAR